MKSPYAEGLVPNEPVTAQFLVISKEIRQKKTGEPYLSLHLADRTGEIEAKMWDNVAEVMHTFERDHFVKVKGLAQLYQNRSQFVIHRLRRLEDHEVDFADYFPCSERHSDDMFAELREIMAGLKNPHLHELLENIFRDGELAAAYRLAPAAKSIHHACRGGLLEHVLSLCTLARLTAAHYPEIDVDLLLTGVILHDIGKVEELSYARSFGYSTAGQLLGHIVLGMRLVGREFDRLPHFPPKLRMLVEHLIISHHGELEFGSPKVPLFPEAMLLHHLDNLDSKMNAMRSAFRRDSAGEGEFTGWVAPLERVLLRKERYLTDAPAPAAAAEATTAQSSPSSTAPAPVQPESPAPAPAPAPAHASPLAPAAGAAAPTPGAPHPESARPLSRAVPAFPEPSLPAPLPMRKPEPYRPPSNTLFGEKLQAVLERRK